MNNLKRWFLIMSGIGLAALLLVGLLTVAPVLAQGPGGMMGGQGRGMMGPAGQNGGYGPGWMMDNTGTCPFGGPGMMNGFGPGGMMNGFGGMRGRGMMWSDNNPFFAPEPLTVAEVTEAINTYLAELDNDNLQLTEVMIFNNQAYAEIVEKDTGIGAMELLVDPATKTVYPEMGPNMMWNLKYGMMADFSRPGMMMGRFGFNRPDNTTPDVSAEMTLTPEEAAKAAQTYLDELGNNLTVSTEHAEPFYGYYTLHVLREGQVVGMLSVNGYSGQVFPHTWHGELLEVSEVTGH
jgi:hypothetical protein